MPDPAFDSADYELLWPRDLFVRELTAVQATAAGLTRLCSARVISAGHAFVQNLRRGHYELGLDIDQRPQLTVIFTELARAI